MTTVSKKNSIPENILKKLGKNLHNQKNHPIEIIKNKIYSYFNKLKGFEKFDTLSPKVSTADNFDKLLIDKNHPSRSTSDTYYFDEKHVLRTHTSAHQNELLASGHKKFLVTGDVYRKDEINFSHYPIFHQMEGVKILDDGDAEFDLKRVVTGLLDELFPNAEYRFVNEYFPFTEPSFEVEVLYNGKWLEVLGCGIIHKTIMINNGLDDKKGWAFGLGLERLAMILFDIPDIRYFWTDDERFLNQFKSGEIIKFVSYSKYPSSARDVSFYYDEDFQHNTFYEIVRENGQDLVQEVCVIDEFINKKNNKKSVCYRIVYQSNDKNLTGEEVNEIHSNIKNQVKEKFKIEIR